MQFKPKSNEHAIVEVVVGLQLAREIPRAEIEAIAAAQNKFPDLPKVGRTSAIQFVVGGENLISPPAAIQFGGITMDRIKPDGSLDWRLKIEGNSIFVNCLSYDNWTNVSRKAFGYLREVGAFLNKDSQVASVLLQYIDVFEWDGDDNKYSADLLFARESNLLPKSIWDKGSLWHLYQGWYRSEKWPEVRRMLERAHIDSIQSDAQIITVKIDSWHSFELAQPTPLLPLLNKDIEQMFNILHNSNIDLLKSLLTADMAKRIGLNAN